MTPHSRGAMRPSCAKILRPANRGRGECRVPDAPAAARGVVNTRVSHHGYTGSPGIPARNGFNGFLRDTTRAAAGASGTRHSPRPLFSGREIHAQLRAHCAAGVRNYVSTSLRGAEATKQSTLTSFVA